MAIIFSIITCGIYSIYWFVKITDELNAITGNGADTSGVTAFVLSLVTCGFYSYYWAYKMGEKTDSYNNAQTSKGVLYLILSILGFGFINYMLIQDTINKSISNY